MIGVVSAEMAASEKSYRVSLAKFGAHLFQDEKKRLQTLYRMPTKYNKLPPEAILQGLEMLGVYSPSRPEGVAELPLWLGMKDVHRSVKKSLKKNKEFKLNEMFCLPLYEELYAAADLQACFTKVQEQAMMLAAHVELLTSIANAHHSGSVHYESLQGPHTLKNISEKLDKIQEDIGFAANDFGVMDSNQTDDYSMGTIQHKSRPLPATSPPHQTFSEKLLRKPIQQALVHMHLRPAADEKRLRCESPPPFLSGIAHSPSFPSVHDDSVGWSPAPPRTAQLRTTPPRAMPPQLPPRTLSRPQRPPVRPKPSFKQTNTPIPPTLPPKMNRQVNTTSTQPGKRLPILPPSRVFNKFSPPPSYGDSDDEYDNAQNWKAPYT